MSHRASRYLPVLLPPEKVKGMKKDFYDYIDKDWMEFDAKIARAKHVLMNTKPQAFDERGRIDRKTLLNFIKNPNNQGKMPILRMFDTSKIEQIGQLFDTYVIAKAPKSPQQQRGNV